METLLSPEYLLALGSLTLLSIADLRDRTLPGIQVFFWASVWFGVALDSGGGVFRVLAVLLVVGWGSRQAFPTLIMLPAVFMPACWPVLLTAGGVRRGLVAQGDLLALGAVACLLPWYGPFLALLGVFSWRKLWRARDEKTLPALPGVLFGVFVSLGLGLF